MLNEASNSQCVVSNVDSSDCKHHTRGTYVFKGACVELDHWAFLPRVGGVEDHQGLVDLKPLHVAGISGVTAQQAKARVAVAVEHKGEAATRHHGLRTGGWGIQVWATLCHGEPIPMPQYIHAPPSAHLGLKLEVDVHDDKIVAGDGAVVQHDGRRQVEPHRAQHLARRVGGAHSDVVPPLHAVAKKHQLPCCEVCAQPPAAGLIGKMGAHKAATRFACRVGDACHGKGHHAQAGGSCTGPHTTPNNARAPSMCAHTCADKCAHATAVIPVTGQTLGCAVKGDSMPSVARRPTVSTTPSHSRRTWYGRSPSCSANRRSAWYTRAVLAVPPPFCGGGNGACAHGDA